MPDLKASEAEYFMSFVPCGVLYDANHGDPLVYARPETGAPPTVIRNGENGLATFTACSGTREFQGCAWLAVFNDKGQAVAFGVNGNPVAEFGDYATFREAAESGKPVAVEWHLGEKAMGITRVFDRAYVERDILENTVVSAYWWTVEDAADTVGLEDADTETLSRIRDAVSGSFGTSVGEAAADAIGEILRCEGLLDSDDLSPGQ